MGSVTVSNVTIEFPIYEASNRSLRRSILSRTAGSSLRGEGRHTVITALKNISFRAEHGDRIGLIGTNGAGKSTLLRTIAGVYPPLAGTVVVDGEISPLFDIALGMDHDATGFENIRICGMLWGLSVREIAQRTDQIAAFSELGDYLNMPVRSYSAGMQLRLAFAIATARDTEILLLDEGIGVGDARFFQKAFGRVRDLMNRSSIMMVASHSEQIVRDFCNKVMWLHNGEILEFDGRIDLILEGYRMSQLNNESAAAE